MRMSSNQGKRDMGKEKDERFCAFSKSEFHLKGDGTLFEFVANWPLGNLI